MAITPKNLNSKPRVVAVADFTGQTSNIATTTMFTPLYSGIYRVASYVTAGVVGSAGTADHTIGWTDDTNAKSVTYANVNLSSASSYVSEETVFWCKAGNNITYAAKITGLAGGAKADLHFVLEALTEVSL